jgi:tetratricopeptide (TPR) repeat protein
MLEEGRSCLEEGRFEEALACFERAGRNRSAMFGRAVSLQLLARFEEAEAEYENLLAADPEHAEALANLVAMNVERFHLAGVEEFARRLLIIAPDSAIALQGLIVVAAERRDDELAATCLARLQDSAERCRDGVEYRLSAATLDRLKENHGPVAHPY